mmetsp:Transcript_17101/g.41606  ORF Transcript_17101/g.41606 Transcript_17101/m.41606 type:complete len:228 (-) Transcript_17101:1098-1781(-)
MRLQIFQLNRHDIFDVLKGMSLLSMVRFVQDNVQEGIGPKGLQLHVPDQRNVGSRPRWEINIHGVECHGVGILSIPLDLFFRGLSGLDRFRGFIQIFSELWRCFSRRRDNKLVKEAFHCTRHVCLFLLVPKGIMQGRVKLLNECKNEVAQSRCHESQLHGLRNFQPRIQGTFRNILEFSLQVHDDTSLLFGKNAFVPIGILIAGIVGTNEQNHGPDKQVGFDRNLDL